MNTRIHELLDEKLKTRGHDPAEAIVARLRAEGRSWRYIAKHLDKAADFDISNVTLINWFGNKYADKGEQVAS